MFALNKKKPYIVQQCECCKRIHNTQRSPGHVFNKNYGLLSRQIVINSKICPESFQHCLTEKCSICEKLAGAPLKHNSDRNLWTSHEGLQEQVAPPTQASTSSRQNISSPIHFACMLFWSSVSNLYMDTVVCGRKKKSRWPKCVLFKFISLLVIAC